MTTVSLTYAIGLIQQQLECKQLLAAMIADCDLPASVQGVASDNASRALALSERLLVGYGMPEIAVGRDGSIELLWSDEDSFYIDVDLTAAGETHFYVRLGMVVVAEEVVDEAQGFERLFNHLPEIDVAHRVSDSILFIDSSPSVVAGASYVGGSADSPTFVHLAIDVTNSMQWCSARAV